MSPRRALVLGRFVGGTCMSVVLLVTLLLAAAAAVTAGLPGRSTTVVGSDSMAPVLHAGDIVALTDGSAGIGKGSIVLVRRPDEVPLLHRVIAKTADGRFRTQGDANTDADTAIVSPDDVLGVGDAVIPLVGLPILWMAEHDWIRLGGVLMVILTGAWMAGYAWDPRHDPWQRAVLRADASAPVVDKGGNVLISGAFS